MNPDPGFLSNTFVLLTVLSAICSNIAVIAVAFRGRPSVRKDEFDEYRKQAKDEIDEHKGHDNVRFDGINKKFESLVSKQDGKLDKIIEKMGELVESIARHEGKLEGMGK